ncbi:Asp-tRNA(Asn)/Glu-tRNA(Gln) amidotransferase subunit GatA [Helcobacillus massiliensis]|uniref:Asp-tRNA(Asn)/Glu-tRNA(Gln) amidotransferase subunit GatA n=1 Tax=Helcobacillus massiliensis TaxID=521392 RepID=UPI002554CF00|nr:Asp-tRNA(Asn)/Glu-tRNA(Gln) amidotransferase subunit GatA [Helcobacillus massiliensis]MDK7742097.1 Asp-tRNA(Asn)/Glu-tRNA(Gln) amidotransferase subunit GatA [Helcobacillus massiliensis]WOO93652.1 Asp-tRNA(Asn)/Glu-tRNA(Gln) amidotransferase subunit GatA [Helcobacillus massiliensis]
MTDLIRKSAAEMAAGLAAGEFSARELTDAHLERIEAVDSDLNAFITVTADDARATADAVDSARAAGKQLEPLAGVPVAVKDIAVTRGVQTTAGSTMLEGWVPPYDATLVTHLKQARLPILGKTNMDEFAMGSSTETSAYGITRNPWNLDRIPGGSGGGSSAAVAGFEAPLAIGTDTGGSIRQPASVTGTVGVKPTYGSVSRYGLIAMASSLDQAGPCTRTVEDAALLHDVIGGYDPKDSTSIRDGFGDFVAAARSKDVKGLRVGVIEQLEHDDFDPLVRARFEESLALLEEAGAEIVRVSCPNFEYALGAYYLIMPSEASSNLAKFDGMRFGLRVIPEDNPTAERVMAATRGEGFGAEVKRRILLGTYALSSGYYDAYYGSAQKVRTLVQRDFAAAYEKVDVLASPTAPTVAFPLGQKVDNPMTMYLNDIATIPANLAGVPGMSLPSGLAEDGLPAGIQFLAPALGDDRLYRVGGALEALLEQKWGGPILAQAPALEGGAR